MTGNEPESTGTHDEHAGNEPADNEQSGDEQQVARHGTMRDAEDDAARQASDDRDQAAAAGDEQAKAEQADKTEQADKADQGDRPNRLRGAAEWLDGKLVPRLGGADVGPYD